MNKKTLILLAIAAVVFVSGLTAWYVHGHPLSVLEPKGVIAEKEKKLIITSTLLMLIVVIPVFILTFYIAIKYRATNTKAKYTPDWDGNSFIETIWWGIPILLIAALSVLAWNSSHELDPFKKLNSDKKPIKVQVVALQWKWLFIYPEEHVASVNFMQIPTDRPVDFEITSDAPMNSMWIPELAGQVYAMSGMSTQLHIMAREPGDYQGVSANLSGKGFAGMKFITRASSESEYQTWLNGLRNSPDSLTLSKYTELAYPSENEPRKEFGQIDNALYDTIVEKYLVPSHPLTSGSSQKSAHETHGDTE